LSAGAGPSIWLLLGERAGDNNQLLALAEELGLPFEIRQLRHNFLRNVARKQLSKTMLTFTPKSLLQLRPPWPDLVIGIGRRSVPVARWIRWRSGNRTKLVQLGNPRSDPALFDLVITTPQYPVPKAPNVLVQPMAMSRFRSPPEVTPEESAWLAGLPRPHLLLAIGGSTAYLDLSTEVLERSAARLAERAQEQQGTLIIVGSPRTQPELMDAARRAIAGKPPHVVVAGSRPRFAVLLAGADEIHVTADSVSMLSEAVLTGRPVGMIPVELNAKSRKWLGDDPPSAEFTGPKRDLRRVWARFQDDGLVGTIDAPRSKPVANPSATAAEAVRKLLGL
jgi:mitochondrial fission protein ELM1